MQIDYVKVNTLIGCRLNVISLLPYNDEKMT